MVHSEVGENFSVESDIFFLKQVDKFGVGNAFCSGGCIDPGDPQSSEGSFLVSPIAEGIAIGFVNGIFSNGKDFGSCAEIAFSCF